MDPENDGGDKEAGFWEDEKSHLPHVVGGPISAHVDDMRLRMGKQRMTSMSLKTI